MVAFLPRSRRVVTEIDIIVRMVESVGGRGVAGPTTALLCNISATGCCIEMESPLVGGHHLFFATLGSNRYHLELEVLLPALSDHPVRVEAAPVWMNGTEEDRPAGFRIGMRFLAPQKQLLRAVG